MTCRCRRNRPPRRPSLRRRRTPLPAWLPHLASRGALLWWWRGWHTGTPPQAYNAANRWAETLALAQIGRSTSTLGKSDCSPEIKETRTQVYTQLIWLRLIDPLHVWVEIREFMMYSITIQGVLQCCTSVHCDMSKQSKIEQTVSIYDNLSLHTWVLCPVTSTVH